MMRHLIIGAGQVGTAIRDVLAGHMDTAIRDIEPLGIAADVLHICFPYGPDFERDVKAAVALHSAELVVVHSTVPPGTCDRHGWVHSPVRGRHPDLLAGLRAFTKPFGGARADVAARHFRHAGVRTSIHDTAAATEAGKVWELAQFGVQVRVCQDIYAWCESVGLDGDAVYRAFAEEYNDGYRRLGHPELVRPVLDHVPGPIGGHCVTAGAALLDHPLARYVTGSGD